MRPTKINVFSVWYRPSPDAGTRKDGLARTARREELTLLSRKVFLKSTPRTSASLRQSVLSSPANFKCHSERENALLDLLRVARFTRHGGRALVDEVEVALRAEALLSGDLAAHGERVSDHETLK